MRILNLFTSLAVFGLSMAVVGSAHAFGPCTQTFPEGVSYIPSVEQCGGKAAVVLYKTFIRSYSVVVRDCNNNDRDPCNYSASSCASNESSPFKAQSILSGTIERNGSKLPARIFCLREAGDSEVYKLVRRITIKLKNPVVKPSDVQKICLNTRTSAVRPVTILKAKKTTDLRRIGFNYACYTQRYLACSYTYENICPAY